MQPEDYENEFFRRQGFHRRVCPKCGTAFWATGDRQICAEKPCTPYSFEGNSPFSRSFTVDEFREYYFRFFESRGHTRVRRYPVVPRWRNDVFFVQASIYDFQPWVTSGAIDPPANPLVISQPCLRFQDIGEVGVSLRHLTEFEMLAHHAFNGKGQEVYFKDRTVELCHELFSDTLGAPSDEITYKEEIWEGGGDMGPSLSVGIRGLELATLVFMQYEKHGEGFRPLPLRIVDTGYGLERISWVSQGTPSIYEAVFPKVLQELPSDFTLQEGAVLVDHARSLSLMLADGVVPSNVREGYLARLLLRRIFRTLDKHPDRLSPADLLEIVIRNALTSFPEIEASRRDILDIVEVEQIRFKETVQRGRSNVRRLQDRLTSEGRKVGLPELLELYDSQGLTPDIVAEELKEPISVPEDFFAQVAGLHEKADLSAESEETTKEEAQYPRLPDSVAPTEVLYHLDPYTTRFEAKVVWAHPPWVVLDRTFFYPTGGGQITDTGSLNGSEVEEVAHSGPYVYHRVREGAPFDFPPGKKAEGVINTARRRQLMQHHTGTHLLNGALRKVLGTHVWQAGAYKGTEGARLDITHYRGLTDSEIAEVERVANRVVWEDRKVKSYFAPRAEAEQRFGFTLYQGGAVPGKSLRIVEVDGFDVEACGGTHCTHTSEVGLLKIFSTERIQDGMVRVNFAAGERALEMIQLRELALREASRKLAVPPEGVPQALEGLSTRIRELEKQGRSREASSVKTLAARLAKDAGSAFPLKEGFFAVRAVLTPEAGDLKEIARELTKDGKTVALLASIDGDRASLFFASGAPGRYPAMVLLEAAKALWPSKGGGNPSAASASGPAGPEIGPALEGALTRAREL